MLQFGALRQVLVKIEKILELKLLHGQHVQLAGWKTGHIESLLDATTIIFVGGEQLDDTDATIRSIWEN